MVHELCTYLLDAMGCFNAYTHCKMSNHGNPIYLLKTLAFLYERNFQTPTSSSYFLRKKQSAILLSPYDII